jgi:hypothetical protein
MSRGGGSSVIWTAEPSPGAAALPALAPVAGAVAVAPLAGVAALPVALAPDAPDPPDALEPLPAAGAPASFAGASVPAFLDFGAGFFEVGCATTTVADAASATLRTEIRRRAVMRRNNTSIAHAVWNSQPIARGVAQQ